MRSRTGYWIAGGLIVAGLLGGVLWFVGSLLALRNEVDDFQRVALPGRATMELEARKYVVYSESTRGADSVPEFRIAVTETRTGTSLRIAPYEASLTYSFFGRDGTARATITPSHPGRYRVRIDVVTPTSGATVALGAQPRVADPARHPHHVCHRRGPGRIRRHATRRHRDPPFTATRRAGRARISGLTGRIGA